MSKETLTPRPISLARRRELLTPLQVYECRFLFSGRYCTISNDHSLCAARVDHRHTSHRRPSTAPSFCLDWRKCGDGRFPRVCHVGISRKSNLWIVSAIFSHATPYTSPPAARTPRPRPHNHAIHTKTLPIAKLYDQNEVYHCSPFRRLPRPHSRGRCRVSMVIGARRRTRWYPKDGDIRSAVASLPASDQPC